MRLLVIGVPAVTIPPAIRLGVFDLFIRSPNLDLLSATDSTFSPYVGQRFKVHSAGASQLELRQVLKRGPASFSLFFSGPGASRLAQSTYQFEHPDLGRFPLFIVPSRFSGESQTYEAVVNHEVPV